MATEFEYINYKEFVEGLSTTENPDVTDKVVVSNETDGPRAIPANTSALSNTATDSDLTAAASFELQTAAGKKKAPANLLAKQITLESTNNNVTALTTYAQNVANSLAPDYDGATGAVAGRMYTNNGILYRCNVNCSGAWEDVSGNFTSKSVNVYFETKQSCSPDDFGAVGDGVTDDTDAVKAAIAYCESNGTTLLFKSGKTYGITSQIYFNGAYPVFGYNSCIKCIADSVISVLVSIEKQNTVLSSEVYKQISCVFGLYIDGNDKCNTGLFVRNGKFIKLRDLYVKNCLVTACRMGDATKNLWEVYVSDCVFNANNGTGVNDAQGMAQYALYVESKNYTGTPGDTGFVTDCYFDNILLINGSTNWARLKCSVCSFTNIHAYSYPATSDDDTCDVGIDVIDGSSLNKFRNLYLDTVRRLALRLDCDNAVVDDANISISSIETSSGKYGVFVRGDNCKINNIQVGNENATAVLVDTLNYTIDRIVIGAVTGLFKRAVGINGKIPYYFHYIGTASAGSAGNILNRNYIFYNVTPNAQGLVSCNFDNRHSNPYYYFTVTDLTPGNKAPVVTLVSKNDSGFSFYVDQGANPRNLVISVSAYTEGT